MKSQNDQTLPPVPRGLRLWFLIHFVVDAIVAIPLLLLPVVTLHLLGWITVDALVVRLAGAAFLAIGIESFISRNSSREVYIAMLNLKIIWSSAATIGIGISMGNGAPVVGWLFLGIFALFCMVWVHYRFRLNPERPSQGS